jgi:hypothetical protein
VIGSRLQGKRTLVLIDAEGAEQAVLQGASRLLGNSPRPIWLIEVSIAEHQPSGTVNPHLARTFGSMFALGYQAFSLAGEMRPVTMAEVQAAQSGDRSALEGHSFLFR